MKDFKTLKGLILNIQMLVTVRKTSLICVTAYYMQGNDLVHAKRRTLQPYLEILTFHFWGAKSLFSISKWAETFSEFAF